MVRGVRELGLEACVTLGMLNQQQAAAPGRGRPDRLQPQPRHLARVLRLDHLDAQLRRSPADAAARERRRHLGVLRRHHRHGRVDRRPLPHAVDAGQPRSAAGERAGQRAGRRSPGTPLADRPPVDAFELVRMCATARILIPRARVRLSAGRQSLSKEAQMLCFLAGANSIFFGDKLLTTANPERDEDLAMLQAAGLTPLGPSESRTRTRTTNTTRELRVRRAWRRPGVRPSRGRRPARALPRGS